MIQVREHVVLLRANGDLLGIVLGPAGLCLGSVQNKIKELMGAAGPQAGPDEKVGHLINGLSVLDAWAYVIANDEHHNTMVVR